jgi:hypothetical protein
MNAKQAAITAFLSRFILTEEEDEIISSPNIPVGPRVFAVIDRCERVREDCLTLASVEEGETKAG